MKTLVKGINKTIRCLMGYHWSWRSLKTGTLYVNVNQSSPTPTRILDVQKTRDVYADYSPSQQQKTTQKKQARLLLHHKLYKFVVCKWSLAYKLEEKLLEKGYIQSILPSPSWSASLIISSTSSSVNFSPMEVMTWRSSAAEMKPLLSRSKTYTNDISASATSSDL